MNFEKIKEAGIVFGTDFGLKNGNEVKGIDLKTLSTISLKDELINPYEIVINAESLKLVIFVPHEVGELIDEITKKKVFVIESEIKAKSKEGFKRLELLEKVINIQREFLVEIESEKEIPILPDELLAFGSFNYINENTELQVRLEPLVVYLDEKELLEEMEKGINAGKADELPKNESNIEGDIIKSDTEYKWSFIYNGDYAVIPYFYDVFVEGAVESIMHELDALKPAKTAFILARYLELLEEKYNHPCPGFIISGYSDDLKGRVEVVTGKFKGSGIYKNENFASKEEMLNECKMDVEGLQHTFKKWIRDEYL